MSLAQSDVRKYSENEEFVPSEVLVVEWNSVTPYPASNNAESQVSQSIIRNVSFLRTFPFKCVQGG